MSAEARIFGTILGLGVIPVKKMMIALDRGTATPRQQRMAAQIIRAVSPDAP